MRKNNEMFIIILFDVFENNKKFLFFIEVFAWINIDSTKSILTLNYGIIKCNFALKFIF